VTRLTPPSFNSGPAMCGASESYDGVFLRPMKNQRRPGEGTALGREVGLKDREGRTFSS
jgi:hypothetical protein